MIKNFALIIGAMKCGTTSLFYYLSQHPQISACRIKEPNFFANDENWSKGFGYYQSLWDWKSDSHQFALEASTHYSQLPRLPNAAQRISEIPANFSFIYLMRNPIERIESHYTHANQARWPEAKESIRRGIHRDLIDLSRYAKQLDEYYKRFSSDKILLIDFDDLKNNPGEVLDEVVDFLKIDPFSDFHNLSKVYNPTNQRLIYPFWWFWLKPIAKYFPTQPKDLVRKISCRKVGNNFKLSSEQQNYILRELHEDFQKLRWEYGFDVSRWGIQT